MKKNLIGLLVCFFPFFSFSQPPVVHQPAQLQADFIVLRNAMQEAHGGLYRFSGKPDWDKRFDDYLKKLNKPMDQREFISLLSALLAETRDGHMRFDYDSLTAAAMANAKLFPLNVMMEAGRMMVISNDTPDDTIIKPGMEITHINGRSVKELIGEIVPNIAGDGFIETGKLRRMERGFATYYWLFVAQDSVFTITAKDAAGKMITTTLTGIVIANRRNNRTNNTINAASQANIAGLTPKENVSLRFINDIPVVSVRSFDAGPDFPVKVDSVMALVQAKKATVMMLDLRGNGGGADMSGAYLVTQFTDKPFRYFDRIRVSSIAPSFATWKPATFENLKNNTLPDPAGAGFLLTAKQHAGIAEQPASLHPFLGKLVVLTDGISFSTTADVTAQLRHLTKAVFVGEETGGAYEGNTSGLDAQIILPHSKLKFKIQLYEYWNAVPARPNEKGRGTLPDYPIEKKNAALLLGIDTQLNKAVEVAGKM
jgi:C-terminal processing protease CtpA/Prc